MSDNQVKQLCVKYGASNPNGLFQNGQLKKNLKPLVLCHAGLPCLPYNSGQDCVFHSGEEKHFVQFSPQRSESDRTGESLHFLTKQKEDQDQGDLQLA